MGEPVVVSDEIRQKAEWRARWCSDILSHKFDDETLSEMLIAGLDKAHSEGVLDAAEICQRIADGDANERWRNVASIIARSLRDLDRRNRAKRPSSSPDSQSD